MIVNMDVLSLKGKLPYEIIESITGRGIHKLTPPQELSINRGLLSSKNMVVAAPTASGKTLIAEIGCVNSILSSRKKAVYIAPMRALVTEKFNEFKQAYPYIKTAMSIGDLDSQDDWLSEYDMIFVSTEKFDSIMRHGIEWLGRVGCFVFDEIHMLGDMSRGPTLEVLITKIISMSEAKLIALSATIGNAKEIAEWLGAELIESDYRPVKLSKGVMFDSKVYYGDEYPDTSVMLDGSSKIPEVRVVQDTLLQKKQILIFYSTRRNAEAGAKRISAELGNALSKGNSERLSAISEQVRGVLERPTEQCERLGKLVRSGVAFHHAGLLNTQRQILEEAFKENMIKVICSTTTLGFGVNMPAHTVLVRDLYRYGGSGSDSLSVNEVLQLFGRAGRPRYDNEGRALIIASTKERMKDLFANYITASPEAIESSLGVVPVLRSHVLSLISANMVNDLAGIKAFFAKSFYALQYGKRSDIDKLISEVIDDLAKWDMIYGQGEKYSATKLGARVSELYIDPLSAKWMIDSLDDAKKSIDALFMICNTLEMRPYVRVSSSSEEEFTAYMYNTSKGRLKSFSPEDYGNYDPEGAFATALMLNDWTEEMKEPELVEKYSSTPGALYTKITNADWLIYSAIELAKILKKPQRKLIDIRVRLRYGIKEELLDLVRLQQIGRVRARMLYNHGIKSIAEIRSNRLKISSILGKEVAEKVLSQV
jgi:helicase